MSNLPLLLGRAARGLAGAVLPQDCFLCDAPAGRSLLCARCRDSLPALPALRCPQCALPTPGGEVCGACLKQPPHFDATLALFAYAFPVDRLVQALKYRHRLALSAFFGRALAQAFSPAADVVIALPLHPARLRERGFNQAAEIARRAAAHWDLPLDLSAAERIADSAPQAALPWAERQRNVRGAFLCSKDLAGRELLVIDDVMTTGATLNEMARALKARGAARVTNCVVARTLPA